MDPDVINFDDLPDDNALPKAAAPQGAPDVIGFDDLPDEMTASAPAPTQAAMVQAEAPGMLAGAGSAIVRGYQDTQVNSGIAEKFRLRGYKTSLEQGGDFETNISDLIMSRKATPEQSDLFMRRVPQTDPAWRAAELARVTNEMAKLDQSIKDAEATRQNYSGKSQPYQDLQAANEAAKKEGRPIMGTLESLWDNPAGIPEFVAEGAYGTAKPIAGAIAAAIALRRGQAAPLAQTLGPIGVSMGITGVDSYKGQVSEMIEKKAREGGIDLRKNPEKMDGLLQDANFIEAVKTDALKAGINDAAWAGISTWLGMTPRIKGIWQPLVQSVAEGATDVSKQLVIDGKVSDPQSAVMSTVAGAAFEGPSYGIARAAGAFGGNANATPPAAPQTEPTPATPAAQTQTAPDVIDIDDLPSVAGETVEAPAAPAPAPAQPQAEATQPAAPAAPAAEQAAPVVPATEKVEPAPDFPGTDASEEAKNAWGQAWGAWYDKYNATHFQSGEPRPVDYITGTPEFEARVAREKAEREAADKSAPAASQPASAQPAAAPAAPTLSGVPPRPERNGRDTTARDAWDDQYGEMRKGGRTHNDDGTPYVPSQAEQSQRSFWSKKRSVDNLMNTLGTNTETLASFAVKWLTDNGWVHDPKSDTWSHPDQPGKTALQALEEGFYDKDTNVQPEPTSAPAPQTVATAQPEAKPAAPVAPVTPAAQPVAKQQTELGGMEGAFNLAGEQVVALPEPVEAPTELGVERENPIATEARARLMKLEAANKGDSDQAKALRRTIERESQPAQPATQAEAPAPAAEGPNVDLAQDKDVLTETKAALAKADADVMAAFKKYGKKSQQYKEAQKAKKKIFEKALAEKSKALEAERDAQPNPRTDAENTAPQSPQAEAAPVAEAGYVVRIGKREYKVGSLAEASKKWMDVQEEIDNQGMNWNRSQEFADIPNPTIYDSSGKQIGWISQNGTIADGVPGKPKNKLFDPYSEPVAEAAPVEQPKANIDAEYEAAAATKKLANIDPLVKEEATRQGFTIGPVYHGTPTGGFNKFDPNRTGSNAGVSRGGPSFTTNQEAAEAYSETMRPEDRAIAELVAKANEIFATIPEDAPGEVYGGTPVGEIRFDTNATDDLSAGISGLEGHADELRKAGYPEQAAKLEALAKEDFEGGKPEVKAAFLRLSGKPREITTTRAKMAEDLKGVRATADSPVVVNLEDGETVYYIGNPKDIKSADAIVRDDAGKVVPLSRRFQESDDIRGAVESAQAAEQPKKEAKPAKTEPTLKEAAKAQKTDQPQTKRARTALAKAIRENGADDKVTKNKYRALLRALKREGSRLATAKDVSQPYLGLGEPADIKAARELLAKKAKKEGKIENKDARKAEILVEQYEAEVDLAQGQLRDDDQIKLVSDKTLNRVVEHVQGMLDAGLNPDADAMNAMRLAADEIARRAQIDPESFGDPIADVKGFVRKYGVGIPLLPKVTTEKGNIAWADTEYSGLQENLPSELSQAGGVFIEPQVRGAGIDLDRARTDATYRQEVAVEAEGMMDDLAEKMRELGWNQLEGGFDVIAMLSDASDGKPQAPEGGVAGAQFKGDPSTVAKLHGGDVNLDMLGSEGKANVDQETNTREPEPSPEQVAENVATEAEYNDPRFDAEPTPAEQVILDAAADNMPTEESILDALDKAAAERLDPKNRSSIGPDLIAALAWQTARDIQKGVVTFAKWAADKARQFPGMKGSLKAIWALAQDIAKRPIDYIRFRALDSIADKVWQNVGRNKGSATLRKIANMVFAKYGPDADATDNDIPTRVNLVRTQFSNIYAGISERFAAEFADMTPEQRRQWDIDFRKHVIDGTTPADPKLAKAVKDFRNLMRDLLAYQRDAGIEMGDQGVNYFPRHYDPDAVEADRPGFVEAAVKMYKALELRLLNSAIADVRKAEKDRPAERRAADKKFGRKEKTNAEYEQEAAEWAQEKIDALEAEHAAKDYDYYQQKAEDWATAITHGDVLGLTLFKTSEGKVTSDATDARKFSNDEAAIADAFLKKNVDDIMMGYIDGAVRGAELARVFGEDGKMFEQMMNKLSKEGVDAETIKETRRLVQKALGVGREQSSKATTVFFDWVNVVLAAAFLGKTFTYNLVLEPISFGIRTGNAYLALKGMADTWKYTIAEVFANPSPAMRQRIEAKYGSRFKFEKAVTETVGEQVGLIQREMERAYINSHWDYSSGEKGSRMAKWLSQRIYRANLMSATEKAKVQASIGIARLALRDNARFLAGDAPIQKLFAALGMDANADKSAAVIMRENGVPEADHKAFAAFVEGLEGKTDAEWQAAVLDPKNKMAKHYRRALQRMSLGMSIKTNQSLKMEMSDSILGRMLMQLMNYSYAYSNLVKDRMYSMAAETAAKDASKIDRLRYAAPLLVGAPLAILGAAASKALIAAMWPSDDEEKRSKETPMLRKAFNWASFAGMFGPKVEYLFKSFERGQAPGGPVGETIFRGGQAAFAAASDPESEKKAYNAKKQLYNSTVKPLVTGSAAAVHPFFGFLGNAAVNKQEVREAVVGDKPKK